MSKLFHIGTILSITHDYLLSPDHIGGVYDILDYMSNDSNYTHQLGRVAEECEPFLFEQLPFLKEITKEQLKLQIDSTPKNSELNGLDPNTPSWIEQVLAPQIEQYGRYHKVYRIGHDDHKRIHPLIEAMEQRPDLADNIIVIDLNEQDDNINDVGDINWHVD